MTSQKLINWYYDNRSFDNYRGNKRDEILDLSSEEFFKEVKKEAKGGSKLQYKDFKSIIQNKIENDTNEWFDERIKDKINNSVLSKQKQFAKSPSNYNSDDEVDQDIQKTEDFIKDESTTLKIEFQNADNSNDLEEIRSRANKLPDTSEKRQLISDIESDERGLRELEYIEEKKTEWRSIIRYDRGTPEEIEEATENLRSLNAQSLGQVRSLKSKDIERSAMGRFFRNE